MITHLSDDQKLTYAGGLLLHHMYHDKKSYDVLLLGEDDKLQPILEWLLMKKMIEIDSSYHYSLSDTGRQSAETLKERYQEMLTYFDVFAHVDLEEGTFALNHYGEFSQTSDWQQFIQDERWDDLRLAVLDHLGGSPIELVYLQFIQEQRFDIGSAGWQIGLNGGAFWHEIEEICEAAISARDLGYEDNDVKVSAKDILNDITSQGFTLLKELYPDDLEIHSNLHVWYPSHGVINPALKPLEGSDRTPLWKRLWAIH